MKIKEVNSNYEQELEKLKLNNNKLTIENKESADTICELETELDKLSSVIDEKDELVDKLSEKNKKLNNMVKAYMEE